MLYSFGVQPRADGSLLLPPDGRQSPGAAEVRSGDVRLPLSHVHVHGERRCRPTQSGRSIVNTPSTRATFVNNVKNLLAANNMTGFNLDWERPNTVAEWGNYTQLAKEMQAAFPAAWEVSVDDYGSADSPWDDSPLFDANAFDQIGMMGYHYRPRRSQQPATQDAHRLCGVQRLADHPRHGHLGRGRPSDVAAEEHRRRESEPAGRRDQLDRHGGDVNGVTRTGTWDIVSRYEVRDNVQLALDRGMAGVMWWTLQLRRHQQDEPGPRRPALRDVQARACPT